MSKIEKVELGDEVKDKVTGFQGFAIARTQWLGQCDRVTVQPPLDKDGRMRDRETFDVPSLEIIKKQKVVMTLEEDAPATRRTGGDQDDNSALRRD